MKKEIVLTILILGLIVTAMSTFAFAQTQTVNVTVGYPSNSNGDLGITSGSYWIGQFPIQITNGGTTTTGQAYCLNYDGTVYEGSTYQANIVAANDTAQWRAVSYMLSWYAPTDNNEAAIDQVAIWRLLDSNYNPSEFNLQSSIENAAANLAANATGKDVARQGDQLVWISSNAGNTSAVPGQTVTFQVQLRNSSGAPRPNVQIDFNATLQLSTGPSLTLNSTYVNSMQAFTGSNGNAQVSVTVPSNAALGSTITVQASTQSVWPEEYLDLTSSTPSAQNLIGISPALCLTVPTRISVRGFIMVMPESPIGAFSMIAAFTAAFVIYAKLKRPTTSSACRI